MGTRIQSHQLKSGLYVSGRPDSQLKEKYPTMASLSVPYTGGAVNKSGDHGKMFDLPKPHPTTTNTSGPNSGPFRKISTSSSSSSSSSFFSGPSPLQPTGLITSGPLDPTSQPDHPPPKKPIYGPGVTSLAAGEELKVGFKVSRTVVWVAAVAAAMGLLVGAFLTVAIKKVGILVGVGGVMGPIGLGIVWNYVLKRRSFVGYLQSYSDAELRGALDGQFVKVTGLDLLGEPLFASLEVKGHQVAGFICQLVSLFSNLSTFFRSAFIKDISREGLMNLPSNGTNGISVTNVELHRFRFCLHLITEEFGLDIKVVTCGSIPLESSYQGVPRCVYVSTELFEYGGLGGKSAHHQHSLFSWGSRYSEKYVADFYISDFQSGLRALVKAGYGAKVAPFVGQVTVVDVVKENKDLSPSFLRWLADRSLSCDNRIMRLKEGYVKEGSTMSVMGVVRRHDNVLMIVPPQEPVSTGFQWFRCLLPTYVEGLVLMCDDNQDAVVIPV